MSRRRSQDVLVGEDSFLDVVGNLVGVLIILVAVVSMQAGNWARQIVTEDPRQGELAEMEEALFLDERAALAVDSESLEIEQSVAERKLANQALENIRHHFLVQNLELEAEIQHRRELATHEQRARIDHVAETIELQTTIERLKSQLTSTEVVVTERKEITHYPTPIAKTVFSDEIHFRLQHGRVSFVPLDSMLQKVKGQAEARINELTKTPEISGQIGPELGFMMEYHLAGERYDRGDLRGVQVRFLGFTLYPTSSNLSESLEEALRPDAQFRARLSRMNPAKTTVSIWVYPESFDEYLKLKEWLRGQGYQIAAWPLENGTHISGGPTGLRTSAQ